MISAGSVKRSVGLMLKLRPAAKKTSPIQVSQRNAGLIDGFAQKGELLTGHFSLRSTHATP